MPRGPKGEKRPADVIGAAVHVMRIATGEIGLCSGTWEPLPGASGGDWARPGHRQRTSAGFSVSTRDGSAGPSLATSSTMISSGQVGRLHLSQSAFAFLGMACLYLGDGRARPADAGDHPHNAADARDAVRIVARMPRGDRRR